VQPGSGREVQLADESAGSGRAALRADAGPVLFVGCVWLVQSLLLLGFVLAHGVNIPWMDEWEMIPALTGEQAITLKWLWSQHNEHRIVISRLVYLAVTKLGGYDFRAGMIFNLLVLSATAAAVCLAARHIRGRALYSDAFFPLVLLHWGQVENLVWGFQIQFVLSSALEVGLLCILMQRGRLSFRPALLLALSALLFPLLGGNGVALVPALAACTFLAGWELRRAQPKPRYRWMSIFAVGGMSIALTLLYFVDYHRPPAHPVSPSLSATLAAALQFLSLGFGSGTKAYWPITGYFVAAFIAATAIVLLAALARSPEERPRALRAALFLGGMGCLAGGVAWARIALYPDGLFASRYATLAAPFLCCVYFVWEAVKRPQARFAQMTLFFAAAVVLVRNRDDGQFEAMALQQGREAALAEIRNGVPLPKVAERYCGSLYLCGTDILADRMLMLRDKEIGDFANASRGHPSWLRQRRDAPSLRTDG
jgi:hypothetical protein